jgi:hypothetical protein
MRGLIGAMEHMPLPYKSLPCVYACLALWHVLIILNMLLKFLRERWQKLMPVAC